jgi:transcriptional regulator with XRE-family HTH domain
LSPIVHAKEEALRGGKAIVEEDLVIGRRVAEARREAGLSQAEVARRLGLAQSRIAKIEIGSRRLLFTEAIEFATLYRVDLAAFAADLTATRGSGE